MGRGPNWHEDEDALLRRHFHELGAGGLQALLPSRTHSAIVARVTKLGLRARDHGGQHHDGRAPDPGSAVHALDAFLRRPPPR